MGVKQVAFDYRDRPEVPADSDHDLYIFSPRADQYDTDLDVMDVVDLRALKSLAFWVQPFAVTWNGGPVRDRAWDDRIWSIVDRYPDALLKNEDGSLATIEGSDISGAHILDFSKVGVLSDFYFLLKTLDAPILLDYGTKDLSWHLGIDISPARWYAWSCGYTMLKRGLADLDKLWLQANFRQEGHSLLLEKVGETTTSVESAWLTTYEKPGDILVVDTPTAWVQESARAIAAINDCYLSIGRGYNYDARLAKLGAPTGERLYRGGNVVTRQFENGHAWFDVCSKTGSLDLYS